MNDTLRPHKRRFNLHFLMTLYVFLIMLLSVVVIAFVVSVLMQLGLIDPFAAGRNPLLPILGLLAISVILSTAMAALGGNRMLKPLRKVIESMQKVAQGDFTVQLEVGNIPELDGLNHSFNKMVEELGSIETLRDDFISTFSHEFKTPIVSIRGFAKLLKDKDLSEEDREDYTEIIIRESERLADLATNVLNLSRLENVGILTEQKHFRLDEQIRRVAAIMESRWKEKNITVHLHMSEVTIYSDEDLLQQVWMNLLDNAIKFSRENGQISMTLRKEENNAVFYIEDNGCGMDEATLAHVFDKFYQSDKSRAGVGNGLGLSLVKQILSLCGGDIQIESSYGKGSRFTVTLPVG